jgi:hypothetical protein
MDLTKKWGRYVPQSKILARWAEPKDIKKYNFKKLPPKVAAIWGLNGALKNWPHEAQFTFVALMKLARSEQELIKATKSIDFSVVGREIMENKSLLGAAIYAVPQERVKKFMEGKIMFSALFRRTIRAEVEAAFKLYKANFSYLESACRLWKNKKDFKHFHIKGKAAGISYEILETAEALVLNYASDCCQGFGGAGESCMISGIESPDQGFLAFREKGKIFAQGWIGYLKEEGVLVIDSLEFKGQWRKSLEEAFKAFLKDLKKAGVRAVAVGISPNRNDFNGAARKISKASLKNKRARREAQRVEKTVRKNWIGPIKSNGIYSDMTRGFYTIIL